MTMLDQPIIGFIGLGVMGRPMATNLQIAGYPLVIHSRTSARAEDLVAGGATWAHCPSDVAAQSDIIITMLPDSPDVEAVLTGANSVRDGARDGTIVVDMSTIDPSVARRLAGELSAAGITLVDAPVSGGEQGAIQGSLSIMIGGPEAAVEFVRPILETLGRTVIRVGESGAGQITKAANQLVVGATIEAVAEALALAARSGVDPARVRTVLLGGFAASRVLEVHGERMLNRDFKPGFRARLHRKDARIVMSLADAVEMPLPAFAAVAGQFDLLVERGDGDLDHSALFTLLPSRAGREAAAGRSDGASDGSR